MRNIVVVAAASVLALAGCSSATSCPYTNHVRNVEGEIAIVESSESIGGSAAGTIDMNDACPFDPWGCVRLGSSSERGLTFRRPAYVGTYALRDLAARVCETTRSSRSPHCTDVDGELVVREVVAPCPSAFDPSGSTCARFDAELTLDAVAEASPRPTASGSAHLVVYDELVDGTCAGGGGGFGRIPLFGLQ